MASGKKPIARLSPSDLAVFKFGLRKIVWTKPSNRLLQHSYAVLGLTLTLGLCQTPDTMMALCCVSLSGLIRVRPLPRLPFRSQAPFTAAWAIHFQAFGPLIFHIFG
ncbi:MAG: hypothetical protein K940chlam7_01632 [Chlamydiae bacterium]|nr:hypothetical protein [Chlamydiota bacterium]